MSGALLVGLLGAWLGASDGDAAGGTAVDPDQAVVLALGRSAALSAAELDAELSARQRERIAIEPLEVRLQSDAADAPFNPYADKNGAPYGPLDDGNASIGLKLPAPHDVAKGIAARAWRAVDALEVEDARRELEARVRLLHNETLALRGERALVQESLALAERIVEQYRARVQAETATGLQMNLARLALLDAATDLEQVDADAARSEQHLAALTGLELPLALATSPTPLCTDLAMDDAALVERARAQSPKLRALAGRVERAQRNAALAWLDFLPAPSRLQLGYQNRNPTSRDSLTARVDINVPLFAPLNGALEDADIAQRRASAGLRAATEDLDSDVRVAVERFRRARTLVSLYESQSDDVLPSSTDAVNKALAAGQADLLTVAEVQARTLRTRISMLHARQRCDAARIELSRVAGDLAHTSK